MSIRILVLAVDAFSGKGGIAQYNRDLVTAMSGTDVVDELTVLPRFGREDASCLPVKVSQRPAVGNALLYGLRAIVHILRARSYDAIFCAHLHLIPVAFLVARLSGARLWLQLHGIEAWSERSALVRRCAERADLVTAVSRHTRRRFLEWTGMDPHRVAVVPNTFGGQFFTAIDRESAKRALGLSGKRMLLTVSRLARSEGYKGHDRVIRALPRLLRQFDNLVYVIVGDGDLKSDLEKLAGEMQVEDAVVLTGHVENDALAGFYRAADVFVMPSTGEGFGIVFLEALACGTPVVAGDADGASDPLQDGRLGRMCDASNLAAEIARELESAPAHRERRRAERAREQAARRHFGREVFESLIRDITESLEPRGGRS